MKKRIVTYGTSLTSTGNWVKMLKHKLPGWKVINSAEGGQNSEWGVRNFDKKVLRHNPHCVLMEFAINDSYIRDSFCGKLDIEKSLKNIRYMIEKLKWSKVFYMTMNPPLDKFISGRNPAADRPDWERYYRQHRYEAHCLGASIINITARWEALGEEKFLEYCPDGLHPNELGSHFITIPAIMVALNG